MSSDSPSRGIAAQKLQVLFSGTGYNFYDDKNQVRADDLLVRQKAASALADAAECLNTLDTEFRHRFVPPATRENPFPPADVMQRVREIGHLRDRIRDLHTRIIGMPAPAQDKVWWRFRRELTLLNELFAFDYGLIEQSQAICEKVRLITPQSWKDGDPADLDQALSQIDQLIRDRWQLLSMPS